MSGSRMFLWVAALIWLSTATVAQVNEETREDVRSEDIDVELREAEERLAAAAARIAELSQRRLPAMLDIERRIRGGHRPMLGVTIGADDERGPVEGVTIQGVTPGSAAAEAGLRAGDVITAVNEESLGAAQDEEANRKLLDFLAGVEEGDTLDIDYLRAGTNNTVEVRPRTMPNRIFAFGPGGEEFMMRSVPAAPAAPGAPANVFRFFAGGGSWSDMEMVSLTRNLGEYFGTDQGLLVVRAPSNEQLKLRDGDVIQRIDGREPTSVSHAMRILGSYQGGETLQVEIMRNRKKETISIEVPDHRQSFVPRIGTVAPATDDVEEVITESRSRVVRERT
ncbi:MAG: PDZ domain-containing protein [Woeseia sp.]